MAMHKIAVISDTHNLLRPEILSALEDCETILHAGDISTQEILRSLKKIKEVYAVRGNNDRAFLNELPLVRQFELYGFRFCMTHIKRNIPADHNADIVIYGHSHRYSCSKEGNSLYLNPGSCGPRRFNQEITMAILTLEDRTTGEQERNQSALDFIHVEKILIPHEDVKKASPRSRFSTVFSTAASANTSSAAASGTIASGNTSSAASSGTIASGNTSSAASSGTIASGNTSSAAASGTIASGNTSAGVSSSGTAFDRRNSGSSYKRAVTTGLIRMICNDVDRERTVDEIAARRHIDPELAEQIVRLYLTHQNVTPEQIMAKMGL